MLKETRIKIAAATTALFVGGLVTFGLASREESPEQGVAVLEASKPKPQVIHRRKVKTVHPKSGASGSGATPAAGSSAASAPAAPAVVAPASQPAVVQAPVSETPTRTQTSPVAGGGDDGYENEEADGGESELERD